MFHDIGDVDLTMVSLLLPFKLNSVIPLPMIQAPPKVDRYFEMTPLLNIFVFISFKITPV